MNYKKIFKLINQRQKIFSNKDEQLKQEEFIVTYNLAVKKIKTYKERRYKDHKPEKLVTFEAKIAACLYKIEDLYQGLCPLLQYTSSLYLKEGVNILRNKR